MRVSLVGIKSSNEREFMMPMVSTMGKGLEVNHLHDPKVSGGFRRLSEIARDIKRDWKHVYFGAVPYLNALEEMDNPRDRYGADSGESIIAYFLANATTWRGDKAREIKKELQAILLGMRN
jgi:hypothetical protein